MKQEVAEAILKWDDNDEVDNYEEVTVAKITGQSRWTTYYSQIYRNKIDNTFWMISWGRGSTEIQDGGPEDISVYQVEPREKTIVEYVIVEK